MEEDRGSAERHTIQVIETRGGVNVRESAVEFTLSFSLCSVPM